MKSQGEWPNEYMNQTFSSYMEYKFQLENSKLMYLIHNKYIKVLGRFIETMYPNLRFDIHIKTRDPKVRKPDWYGHTYMELIIFDVITQPIYNPNTFEPTYRTRDYDGNDISGRDIYWMIDSFIPEINKHLLISYCPINDTPISRMMMLEIPSFECWREFYIRDRTYFNDRTPQYIR